MSTAVKSFKQQCPGCGAPITLKSSLEGKKVDCPKCKFRFVVELPDADDTDGKPVKGKEKDKGKAGKGKAKEAAKKKAEKSKMPLILAGVGILVLAIVGILIFVFMPSKATPASTTPAQANRQPGPAGPRQGQVGGDKPADAGGAESDAATDDLVVKLQSQDPKEKENAKRQLMDMVNSKTDDAIRKKAFQALRKAIAFNEAAVAFLKEVVMEDKHPGAVTMASDILREHTAQQPDKDGKPLGGLKNDPTNLVPASTQTVLFLDVKKLLDSDLSRAVFTMGSYRKEDFQRRLGISVDNLDQVVISGNRDHNHVLGVIRTRGALNWEEVRHALKIEGEGVAVTGAQNAATYYLGKVDFLTEYLSARIKAVTALRKRAAVCKLNDWTLIYGDEAAVKEYLQNPPEIAASDLEKPKKPQPAENKRPSSGGGNVESADAPGGAGQPPGGAGQRPGGAGQPPAGAAQDPGGVSEGGTGGGGMPKSGSGGSGQEPAAAAPLEEDKGRFLTVGAGLRNLIKMAEDGKESFGVFADSNNKDGVSIVDWVLFLRDLEPAMAEKIKGYALAVHKGDHVRLRAVLQCTNRGETPPIFKKLDQMLTNAAKGELRDLLGFQLATEADEPPPPRPGGRQGGQPGAGGGVSEGGSGGVNEGGTGGGGGGGGMAGGKGGGGGAGLPKGGGGGGAARRQAPKDTKTESTLETERRDEFITVDITVRTDAANLIEERLASYITSFYADSLMQGSVRLGDLAFGYTTFLHANEKLPYGAFPRPSGEARGDRPWPPHERVSFLREFLPYLGDDRYFAIKDGINASKSWRDADNVKQGRILIPQFLHPDGGARSVKARSLDTYLAATHFVGMAGIGPDAAYLPKGHKDAGIFGYDRQLSLDELRGADGASHTILMIQTDKSMVGPWIAGGGYTVRGTSTAGNDVGQPGGFSSPPHNGQQGVWVVMGDGSTRFLKKGINPAVFKALCTVWGRDDHGEIDLLAPRERLPVLQQKAAPKPGDLKQPAKPGIVEEEDEKPAKKPDGKKEEKKEEKKPEDDKKADPKKDGMQ